MFHFRGIPFRLPFSPDGHFGGFCALTVVNNGAMKVGMCMSSRVMIFTGSQRHRGEMSGSYGSSVFRFLKKPRNVCLWQPVSIPSRSEGGFPFPDFLSSIYSVYVSRMVAVLMGGRRQNLIVVIYLDLPISDVDCLPMCFCKS